MVNLGRHLRFVLLACLVALSMLGPVKQSYAQTPGNSSVALPSGWAGVTNENTTPNGTVAMGAAHAFGTALAVNNLGLDYGAMFNASVARFIGVFVGCTILAIAIVASKGAACMVLLQISEALNPDGLTKFDKWLAKNARC